MDVDGLIGRLDDLARYENIGEAAEAAAALRELKRERDNWIETAEQFARNADFYRGIVVQIGDMFGEAAKTSDDGTVQDSVLSLVVPELVERLKRERDALKAENERLRSNLAALEDEKNTYIDYVGDSLGQDHDAETLWDAAQRVLSERDRYRVIVERLLEAADSDPFGTVGHFCEHGPASVEIGGLREALAARDLWQYYYRVDGCMAKESGDANCICWHDEGTGPFASEKRGESILEWRLTAREE